MKPLVLTGIAQETPLENPESTIIQLVFNHGELRVPTNEDGLQAVLSCMAAPTAEPAIVRSVTSQAAPGISVFGGDEPASTPEEWLARQQEEQGDDDEDEYDINDGVGSI